MASCSGKIMQLSCGENSEVTHRYLDNVCHLEKESARGAVEHLEMGLYIFRIYKAIKAACMQYLWLIVILSHAQEAMLCVGGSSIFLCVCVVCVHMCMCVYEDFWWSTIHSSCSSTASFPHTHTYTHTHTHICTHTHVAHTHTHMCTRMCTHAHAHTHTHSHSHTNAHTHMHTHTHTV